MLSSISHKFQLAYTWLKRTKGKAFATLKVITVICQIFFQMFLRINEGEKVSNEPNVKMVNVDVLPCPFSFLLELNFYAYN